MTVHCPFCHAKETGRVPATDENQKQVVLVMFDCPFYMRMDSSLIETDEKAQQFLDNWRKTEGEKWLQNVGPILREREIKNMARYSASKGAEQS
jgi:hypothetical protein